MSFIKDMQYFYSHCSSHIKLINKLCHSAISSKAVISDITLNDQINPWPDKDSL